MPFPNLEDIIENVVDQVYLDRLGADGAYHYECLPKNFVKLALVSRNWLNPVRRNLYGNLTVDGPELFLILTVQLRFSPHLAKYVKRATLNSCCTELRNVDGYEAGAPLVVSRTAFRWFLEACPQLRSLDITGGDFMLPLSVLDPSTIKLTDLSLCGCSDCDPLSPNSCAARLHSAHRDGGWLKNIVAFPHLKELELTSLALEDGPWNPTVGIENGSSVCTGLTISNIDQPTSPRVLSTLLRSMSSLKELVLDGLLPMAPGQLKNCLSIVARTLTLLTITDYHSQPGNPQPWQNNTVAALHQLNTLSFNGVPVTPPFFDTLPPRLEHLRFSGATLAFLPAPALATWLKRAKFPLRGVLKKLEVVGKLRADAENKADEAQVAQVAALCEKLGIEWVYQPYPYGPPQADYGYDQSAGFFADDDDDGPGSLGFSFPF